MVTIDWTWRSTLQLPDECLVVVGRTEYDHKSWLHYKELLTPTYYRLLGDPNVVGIAARTNDRAQVAWTTTAWENYEALEICVREQIEWLSKTVETLDTGNQIRHNAYRTFKTQDLPLSWARAERMIDSVMKASPLGADAFPELSRMLGIQTGGKQ